MFFLRNVVPVPPGSNAYSGRVHHVRFIEGCSDRGLLYTFSFLFHTCSVVQREFVPVKPGIFLIVYSSSKKVSPVRGQVMDLVTGDVTWISDFIARLIYKCRFLSCIHDFARCRMVNGTSTSFGISGIHMWQIQRYQKDLSGTFLLKCFLKGLRSEKFLRNYWFPYPWFERTWITESSQVLI